MHLLTGIDIYTPLTPFFYLLDVACANEKSTLLNVQSLVGELETKIDILQKDPG